MGTSLKKAGSAHAGIVADGIRRERDAQSSKVEDEVRTRYAERLGKAGRWRRWLIHRRIRAEIRAALHDQAPSDALYLDR